MRETQSSDAMSTSLLRLAALGRQYPQRCFTNVNQYLTKELLRVAFHQTRQDGAVGTCAASFDIAAKKGAKLGPADRNLCKDNTLPLRKENGWQKLTTSMIQDGAELSIIEIDSASWSGVVPSPVRLKAQTEM